MYGKDITVGKKVVPVIRTIDGPLSTSKEWEKAQEKKQKFLWVVKIIEAKGMKPVYILSATKDAKVGDKFASIDLRDMNWSGWKSREPGVEHKPMAQIKAEAQAKKNEKAKKPVAAKNAKTLAKPAAKKLLKGKEAVDAHMKSGAKLAKANDKKVAAAKKVEKALPGEPSQPEFPAS